MASSAHPGGLAVRVDGGLVVGMGHIVRSLTFVEALRAAWEVPDTRCVFYMRDITAGVEAIRMAGYTVVSLGEEEDPLETARLLHSQHPELLVIDLWDVGQRYVDMLRDACGALTVCLSDLHNTDLVCDLLVNGFVGLGSGHVENRIDGTRALLGAAYKILRPQFAGLRAHEIRPRIERVLITTGGYDKTGISLKALRALQCHRRRLDIRVLVGSAYQQREELRLLIRNHRHPVQQFEQVEHVADQLRWADLVISAAGDTVYEIAACGTPAIVLCHVAHQLETAGAFARQGAVFNLGLSEDVDERSISDAIEALDQDMARRRQLSENAQRLIDGQGTDRVVAQLQDVVQTRGMDSGLFRAIL